MASKSLVVFVRVAKQGGALTSPWDAFSSFLKPYTKALAKTGDDDTKLVLAQHALSLLRLLVACHARWVLLVLQQLPPGSVMCVKQQAALRCLRNGPGDEGVTALFKHHVETIRKRGRPSCSEALANCILLLRSEVDGFVKDTNSQLLAVLWDKPQIVVWYDEAQCLENKCPVFVSRAAFSEQKADDTKDALYALTAAMADLVDEYGWRQALCGPFLDLSDRIALDKYSNISNRMSKLHHASHISVTDMLDCLCHFFHLDESDFSQEVKEKLFMLTGRPGWFYDKFWRSFYSIMANEGWREDKLRAMTDKKQLLEMITRALDRNISEQHADTLVKEAWNNIMETRREAVSPSRLQMELYFAIKMNAGRVVIKSGRGTLIQFGILALHPDCKGQVIVLHDHEPLMARAIEKFGDSIVSKGDKDADPVFRLLRSAQGDLITTNTNSNNGSLFEVLVAWHIVRQIILENGHPPTLKRALGPLLPAEFEFPETLLSFCVHVTHAQQSPTAQEYCDAVAARDDVLHTSIDTLAGADLAFCVRDDEGRRALVLLQVKARRVTSFVDWLRSATPAWQFTNKHQRDILINGKSKEVQSEGHRRRTFAAMSATNPALLSSAVRIAVSLTSYRPNTLQLCSAMNDHMEIGRSSVLPCCASPEAFGTQLYEDLWCEGVVSHPTSAFFFVPFSVEDVDAALATREGLKAFSRKYKGLLKDANKVLMGSSPRTRGGVFSFFKRR